MVLSSGLFSEPWNATSVFPFSFSTVVGLGAGTSGAFSSAFGSSTSSGLSSNSTSISFSNLGSITFVV